MISARSIALYLLRAMGGFSLAKYITRKQLRILCYHGFAVGDEYQVAPVMFMRATTFDRRLQILRRLRIPVITLEEGVRRLQEGSIANAETVITLDDGWASNLTIGLPILEKHGYPACVYVSTEHLAASTEVFNVALYYMIHRCARDTMTLEGCHPEMDGVYNIRKEPETAFLTLIAAAERNFPLDQRQRLLHPIARALGLSLEEVLKNERFRLLADREIQELFRRGIDIQLHTHTHRLPDGDFDSMAEEIVRNREAVREIIGTTPRHFCYPSGKYTEQHPQWLSRLEIVSATTCDPGLNNVNTSVMLLKRFLDSDRFVDIDFEAEICGVREIARRIRAGVFRLLRRTSSPK